MDEPSPSAEQPIMDPVIHDLLKQLKEDLPDADEEFLFRKVRKVQEYFDVLIDNYKRVYTEHAIMKQYEHQHSTPDEVVNQKLKDMKDYLLLNEEKKMKTKKLDESRAKLDLKKEQYQLITSIRLDGCIDLISRYNHLMSKK